MPEFVPADFYLCCKLKRPINVLETGARILPTPEKVPTEIGATGQDVWVFPDGKVEYEGGKRKKYQRYVILSRKGTAVLIPKDALSAHVEQLRDENGERIVATSDEPRRVHRGLAERILAAKRKG